MADNNRQRKGSLQFYPRVRAKKIVPRANWNSPADKKTNNVMGFLGYKAGMVSVAVKDNTEKSNTNGKRIVLPATVIECPKMKIYSVRLFKNGKVVKDLVISNDKKLSKKIKVQKEVAKVEFEKYDFDDVRVILYSMVWDVSAVSQKKANLIEIGIGGSLEEKKSWILGHLNSQLSVKNVFSDNTLVDTIGVTRGFGTQGPVKRFGIALKSHKSEKGVRRPGSLSSFGLRRVTFRAPQAGQTGFHKRVVYNNVVLKVSDSANELKTKSCFDNYGVVKNDFIIVKGSIPGPKKRVVLLKKPIRPTKYQAKQNYEVIEIR